MCKTDPTRYSQRKQIAKEFVYLGRNESNMKDVHGKAVDLIRTLLVSIHKKKCERKQSVVVGTGTLPSGQQEQDVTEEEEEEEELLTRHRQLQYFFQQKEQSARSVSETQEEQEQQHGGQTERQNEEERNPPQSAGNSQQESRVPVPRVTRSSSAVPVMRLQPIAKRLRGMSTSVGASANAEDHRKHARNK